MFLATAPVAVAVRVLTARPQGRFKPVGEKYAQTPGRRVEVRTSSQSHDRSIFIDDDCHGAGRSFKDAATSKPTYVCRFTDGAAAWKRESEKLWATAAPYPL